MSIPMVPRRFLDKSNLDADAANENLLAIQRDIDHDMDQRYTRSTSIFDISGITDAIDISLRQFACRRPATNSAVEIEAIEIEVFTATALTLTLSCSDTSFPDLVLVTTAGVTTESYASSDRSVAIPSSSADVVFTLAFSAAATITAGRILVHWRCDRGHQGDSYTRYRATPRDASTATTAQAIEDELQLAEDAVALAVAADKDLRCEIFVARNLVGTASIFRVPSGARRVFRVDAYAVCAVATSFQIQVAGGLLSTFVATVAGAGATTRAYAGSDPGAVAVTADDPMDTTDDTQITLSRSAGAATILLGYCLVWWS